MITKRDVILSAIKAYMSQINLQHGTTTVENRKTTEWKEYREKKQICSEVSVNSPGNLWSQSGRRKGGLQWEGFAEKESFKPGVEEWRGNGWWKKWVDGTDAGSTTQRTGWCKSGEISAWLTKGSQSWFQRRGEAYWKERSVIRREDDVDGRASVAKDEELVLWGGWTVMILV